MSEVESKRGEAGESQEPSGFRVIDRRRFAADGSERAEDAPPAEPSKGPPGHEASAPGATAEQAEGPDFVMSAAERRATEALAEPTLSTLLLSLSTQALMHLGEIPDLATGESQRDLPAARSIIDLIAVLEHKTRGNLDESESALFDRILYDLRMRFVEISRS